jgi:hypothetical protein
MSNRIKIKDPARMNRRKRLVKGLRKMVNARLAEAQAAQTKETDSEDGSAA